MTPALVRVSARPAAHAVARAPSRKFAAVAAQAALAAPSRASLPAPAPVPVPLPYSHPRSPLSVTARPLSTAASTSSLVSPRARIPRDIVNQKRPGGEGEGEADLSVDEFVPQALSAHQLSLVYTSTTPPPLSALSALSARLAHPHPHPLPLPLLEQALIHPSFWLGVAALPASAHPRAFTLHHDALRTSNAPLATLGNALLGTLAAELVLANFPQLPTRVSKAAITKYVGPKSLAAVAAAWGVGPTRLERSLVGRGPDEDEKRISRSERAYGHLVGGRGGPKRSEKSAEEGAAGAGLIRWNRKSRSIADDAVLFEDAMASVSRAIVGAIYQAHGFAATRSFVHAHFLSRLVPPPSSPHAAPTAVADLTPLLKFTSPTLTLANALKKQHWVFTEPPSHRLLKESGRLSSRPTFLSAVFSGDKKLGEGFGSSIKMSEWRASEDALRRLFFAGRDVGKGLPSDAWGL